MAATSEVSVSETRAREQLAESVSRVTSVGHVVITNRHP